MTGWGYGIASASGQPTGAAAFGRVAAWHIRDNAGELRRRAETPPRHAPATFMFTTFVTAPDGRRAFFPFGLSWRGYLINSASQYQRLKAEVGVITSLGLIPVGLVAVLSRYVLVFSVVAFCVFYSCWVQYRLRRITPRVHSLSLRDSVLFQTQAGNGDWYVVYVLVMFVAGGVFFLFLLAGMDYSLALFGLAFWGCGASISVLMLILRLWPRR